MRYLENRALLNGQAVFGRLELLSKVLNAFTIFMKGFILFGIAYLKHANRNCHLVCVSGSLRKTRNLDKDDLKYADKAKQFAYVQQLELYLCRE